MTRQCLLLWTARVKRAAHVLFENLLGLPALDGFPFLYIVLFPLGSVMNTFLETAIWVVVVKVGSNLASGGGKPPSLRSGIAAKLHGNR